MEKNIFYIKSLKWVKQLFRGSLYLFYLFAVVFILLEITYRNYWFDFYGSELALLNNLNSNKTKKDTTLLALGDSFSADPNSYLKTLRQNKPHWQIINSAISGTTITQSRLMAKKRNQQFNPDILIYQIYVGNDLLEYDPPYASSNISFFRKSYWFLSRYLKVLPYLNIRLKNIRTLFYNDTPPQPRQIAQKFDPKKYSHRSRLYFQAEPDYLYQTIFTKEKKQKILQNYFSEIRELLHQFPETTKKIVLVIPHCIQVSDQHQQQMEQLGCTAPPETDFQQISYPFLRALQPALKNSNAKIINALEFLQTIDNPETLFFTNDPHLTPEGQKLLGEWLSKELWKTSNQ